MFIPERDIPFVKFRYAVEVTLAVVLKDFDIMSLERVKIYMTLSVFLCDAINLIIAASR